MARTSAMQLARFACAAVLVGVMAPVAPPATAQTWRITPAISVEATATNNVDLSPSGSAQEDLVTIIRPSLTVTETGAHTRFNGHVAIPIALYARTGNENNDVYPTANLLGNAELVDDFFYVEGEVSISQRFLSPFGAQPPSLANSTENRYQSATYRVSPYIRGVTPGNIAYELRNTNIWDDLSGTPVATNDAHYIQWIGSAWTVNPTRIGWSVYAESTEIRYNDQRPIEMRLARLKPSYNVGPDLQLWINAGYEDNEFTLTESHGAIYGGGFEWRPTPRTIVVGNYEHRFFGASYQFSLDHRTALSVWHVRVARDITSYTSQLGTLPAGVGIAGIIDGLFLSRIADPTERQQAVDEFIRDRGLPDVLSSPLALYSQQILLQESQTATAGLIGARNAILFTVFNVRSEPIAGSGNPLPAPLAAGNDNTQTGANAVWSLRVTPSVLLAATIGGYRTVANAPREGTTRQGFVRLLMSSPLSAKTSVYAGARYQVSRSDVSTDYDEAAVFVGMSHTFR